MFVLTLVLLGLATFSSLAYNMIELLPAFISVLLNVFIAVFVLMQNAQQKTNKAFCLFTICVGAWALGLSMFMVFGQMEYARITYAFASFIPALFFAFTTFFPIERNLVRIDVRIGYLIALAFALASSFTGLVIKGVSVLAWGITLELGALYFLFAIYFFGLMGAGFINLILKYRTSSSIGRSQIRYVFVGTLLSALIGMVVAIIMPLLGLSRFYFLAPPATLFMVGFLAYAITKHRLMDISVIISRIVAEIITVLFLASVYLGLVLAYRTYVSITIGRAFLLMTILYGILVGQVHQKIRLFVQTTADKLFLRGKYDYYKELSAASMRVGEKLSLDSILKILYSTFSEVVEVSNPRIFLPEQFTDPIKNSKRYLVYDKKTAHPLESGEEIKMDEPLVKRLISSRTPILRNREWVVPCLLEDRLIAIFVLGKKLSEDPYTDDDIRLLEVLASQVAIALDHTRSYEKIAADLEVAERQLSRSQRLASLGTLTAGVTHEIRNPLTVVRSETERIANKERSLEDMQQYRDLMLKHIDRIAGIVQRMLSMAKERPQEDVDVELNEIINASLQLVAFDGVKLKKDIELVPLIKGDPIELEEIFVNLFQNAVQAMPKGGTLTVRTYIDEGRAVAEVTDTGKGIPKELQEKIFDPFFSTRHEGVGLGLSIAYRIIREHGGDIRVKSEVGKGTTFKILF